MTGENSLHYISVNSAIVELNEVLSTIRKKVKHGKLRIQRKKLKDMVMKKHKPTDYKRDNICKNARKKAHSVVANSRRNISNDVREEMKEINPSALTLTERYGLDFIEEPQGFNVNVEFFDKPEITPVTEGLTVGTTKTGRKRKCKAIGFAEGVFAPISTPEGDRVFSRNNRLYEDNHWDTQFMNQNFVDRLRTRRMLGTIGHYDKKVDDKDLADGKVSHIVTDLEIREDDVNGRYLWGRLEIINTPAGKLLKEYYDNGIPLFVSSRGGGKLINVPGKSYKMVDKNNYYCETFDVVKEPGFLEACPEYHSESNEVSDLMDELRGLLGEIADKTGFKVDEAKLAALKDTLISESKDDAELDEDNNMAKVNVDVTAEDTMQEVVDKVVQPMQDEKQEIVDPKSLAESIAELTAFLKELRDSDVFEKEETSAEEPAQSVSEEESAEEVAEVTEPVKEAEEAKVEEPAEAPAEEVAPAAEEVTEAKEDDKEKPAEEEHGKDCKCEKCAGKKEDKKEDKKEEKADECSEDVAEPTEEPTEPVKEATEEVASAEKVEEQWAHVDPKETAPATGEHKAPEGNPAAPLKGDVWANEPAPAVKDMEKGENAPQTQDPTNKEEQPAVNGAIIEAEEAVAEEPAPASEVSTEEEIETVDYKKAYEEAKAENEEAAKLIEETMQLFKDFGKRHNEVVAEAQKENSELAERVNVLEAELNSIKISEKFDVTIETAKEMLSSKTYEEVEAELKESEAKQIEDEAQAKAEEVSESVKEEIVPAQAPVSRQVYSAFAKSESTSEAISEEKVEEKRRFSWF